MSQIKLLGKIENVFGLDLSCSIYESGRARYSRLSISRNDGLKIVLPKRVWHKENLVSEMLRQRQDWIIKHWKKILSRPQNNFDELDQFEIDGQIIKKENLGRFAKISIVKRVAELSKIHGLEYMEIKIRNNKRTWGTCHRNRNLSFSQKLVLLPEHLRDYVICHELAHLIEFNHSKKFWRELEIICPNSKKLRKELKNFE